jgi:MFS family permease
LVTVDEPDDVRGHAGSDVARPIAGAWQVLRCDHRFRRLAWVVLLSSTSTILFPHYQALARVRLGLVNENLMIWVVVQNAAMGVFGMACGWVAHRFGERLSLIGAILSSTLAPLAAVFFAQVEPAWGRNWFWLVFVPMGMNPILLKTLIGYTLEISPAAEHPRYLSTLSLCMAAPFLLSPVVGWLVDATSFESVFLAGAGLIFVAGLLAFRLVEPRHSI